MEKNENGYSIGARIADEGGRGMSHDAASPLQLAMVYAPVQHFRAMYSPEDALSHGTLFEELYKPLGVGGSICE